MDAAERAAEDEALFARLLEFHRGDVDRQGECHVTCPNPLCSNGEPKAGAVHFSFSVRGGKCFVCGNGWPLSELAAIWLGSDYAASDHVTNAAYLSAVVSHRRRKRSEYPTCWLGQDADWYAARYQRRLDLVECWQQYKPLTLTSVGRWKLGVGPLPFFDEERERWYWSRFEKLIVPVFRDGKLVALRGRAFLPDDPASDPMSGKKWMNATGTQALLFNGELVQPGDNVAVVENMIDAILLMQYAEQLGAPERLVAVASTAGAGTWKPSWTAHLAAKGLTEIVVALDNDLAGQPNRETYRLEQARWRMKHPDAPVEKMQKPNGPRIANELTAAGVQARLYHWPSGTPIKADALSLVL